MFSLSGKVNSQIPCAVATLELLEDVHQNNDAIIQNPGAPLPNAEHNSTEQSRFKDLTDGKVDDLALNTCKNKTHKQTNWGVKVLRCKEIL